MLANISPTNNRISSFNINDILGNSIKFSKENYYQSNSIHNIQKQKKNKTRTTFTGKQIFELEKKFEVKKYLSSVERAEMAASLSVTETQIKVWYVFAGFI